MSRCLQYVLVCVLVVVGLLVAADELTAQQKAAVPGEQAQQVSQKAAGELYGGRFRQVKTTAEKTALATEIIDAALKVNDGSADQYVLLKIARDVAAGVGDAPTALRAVEKTVERFDLPGAKLTAETLQAAARKASTSSQQKAVAEAVVSVVDAVADEGEYDLALSLCELARAPAQKSKQYSLAKELTAKIEELKKRQRTSQEYRDALAVLEQNPTDPAGNLAAGRYLCLVQGDWDRGVPMLALGSDADLKAAATKDLGGPNSADEQAALGDAWWALAENKKGAERDMLRLRAGFWYRQAEPKLAGGLSGLKVKQRLAELGKVGREIPTVSHTAIRPVKSQERGWRTTRKGYPVIAGAWLEGGRAVQVVQDESNFIAECTYNQKGTGEICWRCEGRISTDGQVVATLVHTKAPASWAKTQSRQARMERDGNTLRGQASWNTGGHDFTWTRQ